jgi:hypothetical protein
VQGLGEDAEAARCETDDDLEGRQENRRADRSESDPLFLPCDRVVAAWFFQYLRRRV